MPGDSPVNTGDPDTLLLPSAAAARVLGIQSKLHVWAAADPDRRFDDLFNLVADPAFLLMAWRRVRENTGARSAGVDGFTASGIENTAGGIDGFLTQLRSDLKAGVFIPLPVRERMIPKPSGKLRRLGIPTVRDRVVQAALKLVLEPIFETGFSSSSYGFRPGRRAQDAVEDILHHARVGYVWVFETDIAACFDEISHPVLMDRVRQRIGDKRVLTLVKAFLKSGILTSTGEVRESLSGTPQGGILSPLLANIALSVIDEHFDAAWAASSTGRGDPGHHRRMHRRAGGATYRLVRYADDLVVMVHGTAEHAHALRGEVAEVAARIGLRLAEEKTHTVHIDDGFDFLGFRIQRHTQWGTTRRRVYTYPSRKAVTTVRGKVKALTGRATLNLDPAVVFALLGQTLRGWTTYYRHGASKTTFSDLEHYLWHRVWTWLRRKHHRRHWKWITRTYAHPHNRWGFSAGGRDLFNPAAVPIQRYRYRGNTIPTPWSTPTRPATTHT